MHVTKCHAIAFSFALALAACSGSAGNSGSPGPAGQDGAPGAPGAAGANLSATAQVESCGVCHATAGADHQALYNSFADGIKPATTQFAASIVSVETSAGTLAGSFKSTVTFTLTKAGQCPVPSTLKQKTMYFVSYDATAKKFPTPAYNYTPAVDPTGEHTLKDANGNDVKDAKGNSISDAQDPASTVNFSFDNKTMARTTDTTTCTYTMVKDGLSADPLLAAANSFAYGYFGDAVLNIPVKPTTHYALMDNMVSVAKIINGSVPYASTANVKGCEKCHGAPYSKHGYRQATVAGLPDFVACKACHTDFRRGTDGGWYLVLDNPTAFATQAGVLTDAQKTKYAYTANVMQDTHNSHAFEFEYPQSMANCVTCHESTTIPGAMNLLVLTDANFTLATCKSCHPVTGATPPNAKRAPSLTSLMSPAAAVHPTDLYGPATDCTICHKAGGAGKTFSQIHSGYDKGIYDSAGAKYAKTIKAQVDSASFDSATNKLTVNFSVVGASATSLVQPTVVVSLYGYDSKDFIVTGHGSQPAPDGKRNLEWTAGSTSNSPRLTVVAGAAAASWVATADLTLWASQLADGSVKRLEIGILPSLGLDQTKVPQTDATKAGYNPNVAIAGQTRTFDLVAKTLKAIVADTAGIVSADKCNKCHDTLATTFHSPSYGSAGVTACRLCHVGLSGGSHLELQSRSIDSYIHAIHTFQAFDIKGINFADPASKMLYGKTIESTYPNFTTVNCESCHNAGTYGVPDQSKSMPGVLSASAVVTGWDRSIGTVPSVVTGPASRACGSCHRAAMINEDDAGGLASFDAHTAAFGTRLAADTGVIDATIAKIMATFK